MSKKKTILDLEKEDVKNDFFNPYKIRENEKAFLQAVDDNKKH